MFNPNQSHQLDIMSLKTFNPTNQSHQLDIMRYESELLSFILKLFYGVTDSSLRHTQHTFALALFMYIHIVSLKKIRNEISPCTIESTWEAG